MRAWGEWVGEGGTDGGKEDGGKEPDTVLRASHSHHTTTEQGARAPTARIAATAKKEKNSRCSHENPTSASGWRLVVGVWRGLLNEARDEGRASSDELVTAVTLLDLTRKHVTDQQNKCWTR
jgi:hypothetical protein